MIPQRSVISLTVIFPSGFSFKSERKAPCMAFLVMLTLAIFIASSVMHFPVIVEFLSSPDRLPMESIPFVIYIRGIILAQL